MSCLVELRALKCNMYFRVSGSHHLIWRVLCPSQFKRTNCTTPQVTTCSGYGVPSVPCAAALKRTFNLLHYCTHWHVFEFYSVIILIFICLSLNLFFSNTPFYTYKHVFLCTFSGVIPRIKPRHHRVLLPQPHP